MSDTAPTAEIDVVLARARRLLSEDTGVSPTLAGAIGQSNEEVMSLLGRARRLRARGNIIEASELYRKTIHLDPQNCEAMHELGVCEYQQGDSLAAIGSFCNSLEISPSNPCVYNEMAMALSSLAFQEEALVSFDKAVRIKPDFAVAHFNRGTLLTVLERHSEALHCFDLAISMCEDFVEAHYNRGNVLVQLFREEEALLSYATAVSLRDSFAEGHYNLGNALSVLGKPRDALRSLERAIALRPGFVEANYNAGLCYLQTGAFSSGWPLYEWRWQTPAQVSSKRDFSQPQWSLDDNALGRTLLVHAEQGFGDTIQFCRYVSLVADRGWSVIVEVPASLRSLLESLDGPAQIVARGDALPPFDMQIPMLSLPWAFRTEIHTIPSKVPYLKADHVRVEHWKRVLGNKTASIRIGLVWSGRTASRNERKRAIPLQLLTTAFSTVDVELVSLQKDVPVEDLHVLNHDKRVRGFRDSLKDFSETAALISNLDLVVSIDTAVAHLAGALGKPLWIVLPYAADWRWLLDRSDSPWYPSARLFRQLRQGDWANVIEELRCEIAELLVDPV
jgi:tetratricopeptide (TPR) repeat protein